MFNVSSYEFYLLNKKNRIDANKRKWAKKQKTKEIKKTAAADIQES